MAQSVNHEAFLIMHSQIDEPGIPSGIAIFGSDDTTGECPMLYFDERGVSRRYEVSFRDDVWKWWRNAPGFSQRFTGTIAADGRTIVGRGELSRDGASWEPDLQLTYTRGDQATAASARGTDVVPMFNSVQAGTSCEALRQSRCSPLAPCEIQP